jgi:hypothetical protein
MDFFHGIVALLALVVLVLTSMMAWMYVQQSRLMQAVSALTAAITAPPPTFYEAVKEFPIPEEEEQTEPQTETKEDDRVSVKDDEEESQPDDVNTKTMAQLRELLTAKGIPFNKSDKKPVLVNLLKAAS